MQFTRKILRNTSFFLSAIPIALGVPSIAAFQGSGSLLDSFDSARLESDDSSCVALPSGRSQCSLPGDAAGCVSVFLETQQLFPFTTRSYNIVKVIRKISSAERKIRYNDFFHFRIFNHVWKTHLCVVCCWKGLSGLMCSGIRKKSLYVSFLK